MLVTLTIYKERTMDTKEYQAFARVGILPASKGKNLLVGFALGLAGESGEVCDAIKKREYHGRQVTDEHLIEELGDVMWYVANLCTVLNVSLDVVLEQNVDKLKKRYPEMYGGK